MHRTRILTLLVLVLTLVVAGRAQVVGAQDICDDLVIDEAGVFGDRVSEVEAEAEELVRLGADVRVRTISSYGNAGNLDNYESNLEQQCASWQAPNGGRKNNLIVLMISVEERRTGLYYGSQWESTLGPNWTRIQTDFMNPRFRDGDFAGGFIAGLGEIQRLVDLQVHPQTGTPPPGGAEPVSPPQSEPVSQAALWVFLGVVGVVAVALVAGIGLAVRRSRRLETEKRRAARQKAQQAKEATTSILLGADTSLKDLEVRVELIASQLAEQEKVETLQADLANAQKLTNQASSKYQDLQAGALALARAKLLPAQDYARMEAGYNEALAPAKQAEEATSQLEREVEEIERMIGETPKIVEAAGETIQQARAEVSAVAEKGFRTGNAGSLLDQAEGLLSEAKEALGQRKFLAAHAAAKQSLDVATVQAESAKNLPALKLQIDSDIQKLSERIPRIREQIVAGKALFDQISAKYAESSWSPVRGNGTESENRVAWALEAVEAAQVYGSMDRQEWTKAQEALSQANAWLDEADSFMRSIGALKGNLESAEIDAAPEVSAAQTDVRHALEYIEQHRGDIQNALVDSLEQARQRVDRAAGEMAKPKPDYLLVVKLAKEANAAADQILIDARSQYEAAERLRAKAKSAVRDARSAVSKAEEYIEDHSRDVGAEAKALLDSSRNALRKMDATADLNEKVSFAEQAERDADAAYDKASRDFREADERRRPPTNWVFISSSWASRSSSGWGGHHGGGRSGGGGGSSGWGSSGGGGGGSTGW